MSPDWDNLLGFLHEQSSSTPFVAVSRAYKVRDVEQSHSHHKMLLESTFYKMSPRKCWSAGKFLLFRITWYKYRRTTKPNLKQRCSGWYQHWLQGGFVGTNPNLAELLPPLGTDRQWESVLSGNQKSDSPFFFFFPFSLFFFLIDQFLNEFRDISSDRWSALDMLLAPGHKPSLPEQNPARNLKKWRETSLHSLHVLFLAKSQFEVISFKHLKNALKCIKNSTVNFYGIASLCFEAMFQNGFGSASLLWLNISFSLKISLKYVRKSSFWLILPLEVAWTKGWETVLNRGKHCFQNFPHNTVSISLKSPLTLEEKKKNKYLTINSIF